MLSDDALKSLGKLEQLEMLRMAFTKVTGTGFVELSALYRTLGMCLGEPGTGGQWNFTARTTI